MRTKQKVLGASSGQREHWGWGLTLLSHLLISHVISGKLSDFSGP